MTCICIDDLRPASFRGVRFWVKSDKGEYGRRNVEHLYPMKDRPYIEDMGEKAQKFSVQGYVYGDDWIAQKDALIVAARVRGPAFLQLPAEGPKRVACNNLHVARNKDECGFFEISFDFVSADNSVVSLGPVGMFEGLIGAVISSAISLFTTYFDERFVARGVAQYVVDRQEDRITAFTSDAIRTVESTPSTDTALSSDIVQTAISIYQNGDAFAQPGASNDAYLASLPIPAQTIARVQSDTGYTTISDAGVTIKSGASAIVPLIAYVMNGIGNSMRVDDAIAALTPLASWSVSETTVSQLRASANKALSTAGSNPISPSDMANAVNGSLLCGMVRSFALMKLAQAISVKPFETQREAVQARATIVELFNMQIALFDEDAIVDALLKARDYAVRAVSQRMATIVPVIKINAPMSKPSLYWAARLYDDANRAEELADRNEIASPAFMPVYFEALAR